MVGYSLGTRCIVWVILNAGILLLASSIIDSPSQIVVSFWVNHSESCNSRLEIDGIWRQRCHDPECSHYPFQAHSLPPSLLSESLALHQSLPEVELIRALVAARRVALQSTAGIGRELEAIARAGDGELVAALDSNAAVARLEILDNVDALV